MREESHLDDMRSAIRGDFERLAERRGGQERMSVPADAAGEAERDPMPAAGPEQPEPLRTDTAPTAVETETESQAEQGEPAEEPEPLEAHAGQDEPEEEIEHEEPRRSWLDRLLGR
jgi:hypothetical protein